ncbi:MAG: thioredoxin domain-containing protein, partial [Pseudomonadota bacterium]|nr:thioredoxin domain-containing protein [Pseudomonadota bacterium]
PSGNGIAAQVLARLGYILGETRYLDATERTLKFAARMIGEAPVAHASLLTALEEFITAPQIVILRGAREKLDEWYRLCIRDYAPGRLSFAIPNDARDLPDALAAKSPQDETVAYICEGMTCSPPISEQKRLEALLANTTTTQM